ncbi:MAG: hypothetical protein ABIK18_04290 [candidate division WOR-3 bacterium]
MFERILYIISEKQEEKHFVLDLVQKHSSTLLLSALTPVGKCPPPLTEGQTRQAQRQEEHERRCWQDIYRLEDEFKKAGVKASVVAQLGTIEELQSLVTKTHSDLCIIPTSVLADYDYSIPEELLANLPCQVLLFPSQ